MSIIFRHLTLRVLSCYIESWILWNHIKLLKHPDSTLSNIFPSFDKVKTKNFQPHRRIICIPFWALFAHSGHHTHWHTLVALEFAKEFARIRVSGQLVVVDKTTRSWKRLCECVCVSMNLVNQHTPVLKLVSCTSNGTLNMVWNDCQKLEQKESYVV